MHLVEVFEVEDVREDATGLRIVLQIIKDAVDLVEFAFGIDGFLAELISIGFADRTGLVGPGIPDVGVEVMDVVALLLPNPKDFVDRGAEADFPKGYV